jgi:choline dehydrogenase
MRDDTDFVVIGAGSSGCVVARRLSDDPSVRVLLLEAGEAADGDGAVLTPGRWVSLMGSRWDWAYTTEPERGLAGRTIAAPRGKLLGGSSGINAMAYVRGSRLSLDAWRDRGNPGWGYDDLRPMFERAERDVAVSECRDPHAGHEAFLAAAAAHGIAVDRDHDFNGPQPDSVAGFYRKNIRDGRRHSAAAAFLDPVRDRPNLEVRTGAHATRLIVEDGRCTGVEVLHSGQHQILRAAREVIVCAGAVESPKLLMLSGIGPAADLRRLEIRPIVDLAGVGAHLQDHLKLSIRWHGVSPLPGSTVSAGLFTTSSRSSAPDLQLYVGRGAADPDPFVTITVSHVRPRSRGRVWLRSADPLSRPAIECGYLQAQSDADALVEGARLAQALLASPPYAALRLRRAEPADDVVSDRDLETFVRGKAESVYHLAGSCRMGPSPDDRDVVDAALRVYGVDGLRVADASIMPEIIDAPTHAVCLAIGEKCAQLIRGRGGEGARGLA